jgi:hypothetical protein
MSPRWTQALMLVMLGLPLGVSAAGGHHAVDDAELLDPGVCEVEGWWSQGRGQRALLHAGSGCRIGPVELGLGVDQDRDDEGTVRPWSLQAKWAAEVRPGLKVGMSLSPSWTPKIRPRERAVVWTGLVTGAIGEQVRWHANLGRAWTWPGTSETRLGVSADWSFRPGWQVMVERYKQDGGHQARAGLRWQPTQGWTVDASRSLHLAGTGAPSTTLGLTIEID